MPHNYKTELSRYRRYYQSLEPILGKPKTQTYTTVVFSFLAVSLFGWYAIRPTIQTILTLRREIQDKTEVSQKMEDKISALIEAQAAYSQVENVLPVVSEALPASPDAIPLLIQLRNLANTVNVTLAAAQLPTVPLLGREATPTAKTKATNAGNKLQSFEVSITVVGDYASVQAFLAGLSEMRRITDVTVLSAAPEGSSEPVASESAVPIGQRIQITLRFTSYYFVE